MNNALRQTRLVALVVCVAGCPGGGDQPSQPPSADAGPDQVVALETTVTLNGSGFDPDQPADTLDYAWAQTAGRAVSLSNANQAQATFTAPQVSDPEDFAFELTVTDSGGLSASDAAAVKVVDPPPSVTISGVVDFEFVHGQPSASGGLDYGNIETRPIRGAPVEAVDGAGDVLDSIPSDAAGRYALTVPPLIDVFVRVRVELKQEGTPSWDVEVRDNTSDTDKPLSQRPIYVLDGPTSSSGLEDSTRNLLAETGWTGEGYTEPRASGPFSILDVIYAATELVVSTDPTAELPPLDVFWSINNRLTNPPWDPDLGELPSSFYEPGRGRLFLVGAADLDTDEFDTHVIAHEWGHYFEDKLSRSDDALGGPHGVDDRLDMRVAYGEGFGYGIAGMIMDDPILRDSYGRSQAMGVTDDLDDNDVGRSTHGWYNEQSVQVILWDLFDEGPGDDDDVSLGFAPLYEILVHEQRFTPAFTSIFTFIPPLKASNPSQAAAIDDLVEAQDIHSEGMTIYGDGETNDAGNANVLPVYTDIVPDDNAIRICSTNDFEDPGDPWDNKLGFHRFLRTSLEAGRSYRLTARTTPAPTLGYSDPEFEVYLDGELISVGDTPDPNEEVVHFDAPASGVYVIDLYDWAYVDNSETQLPPTQNMICYEVSIAHL